MFFKDYSKDFENMKKQFELLNTQVQQQNESFVSVQTLLTSTINNIHAKEEKLFDLEDKVKDNMKRINEMILELKGVVAQARAALSERKVLDEFLVLAEKRLIELVDASKEYCDKKIKKELTETRSLLKDLRIAFEKAEPYARLVQIGNTLERIEQGLEKPKRNARSKS